MADETTMDTETILLTLDQLSQTVEVMNHVLAKLRRYLHEPNSSLERQTSSKKETQQNEQANTSITKKGVIH